MISVVIIKCYIFPCTLMLNYQAIIPRCTQRSLLSLGFGIIQAFFYSQFSSRSRNQPILNVLYNVGTLFCAHLPGFSKIYITTAAIFYFYLLLFDLSSVSNDPMSLCFKTCNIVFITIYVLGTVVKFYEKFPIDLARLIFLQQFNCFRRFSFCSFNLRVYDIHLYRVIMITIIHVCDYCKLFFKIVTKL